MQGMKSLAIVVGIALCIGIPAWSDPYAAAIDTYLQPYVRSGNMAGAVLVEKKGKIVFEKAYGFADREHRIPNKSTTRFHIASLSMPFTAAAVLKLVDAGSIHLDDHVDGFVPGIEGAEKITLRDLLVERSGLPDINALLDYDDVLQHHQTAASLIAKIAGRPLLFAPGSKFLHEEHSAYNLLALIVENKTGLPFATALQRLVFLPMGLHASGVDDDSTSRGVQLAKGYQPEGTYGLKPATAIHWSGKTGNASVYTTAEDEARWVDALFRGHALSETARGAVLDTSMRVGYGWFKGTNKRFDETAYYMNGRAPGFASFVLYLPKSQTTVVVLSNIYSSATTAIGYDIAALSLDLPNEPFHIREPAPDVAELRTCAGTFRFGSDFYQANAELTLTASDSGSANGGELTLHWPSGEFSSLIPVSRDHFIDRSYWEPVKIERDASGQPVWLVYGDFRGKAPQP